MPRWLKLMSIAMLFGLLLAVGCAPAAKVEKPEDFYKGKTVTFVVFAETGGGQDLTARILAPYFEQRTGARVGVVTKPEGGGIAGLNWFYKIAQPDGLTLGITSETNVWQNELSGLAGVEWKSDKFEYLFDTQRQSYPVYVKKDGPFKSAADLQKKVGVKFGGYTPAGAFCVGGALTAHILGLKDAKVVPGIKGTSPIVLAIKKGEVDAAALALLSGQRFTQQGDILPLFTLTLKRIEFIKEVPTIGEVTKLTEEHKRLLENFDIVGAGRIMFVPPGTPKERVEFLRRVFIEISKTSGFQNDMVKLDGDFLPFFGGEEVTKMVNTVIKQKAVFEELQRINEKYLAIK